jgi:NitT/TauT family transport system permease protein
MESMIYHLTRRLLALSQTSVSKASSAATRRIKNQTEVLIRESCWLKLKLSRNLKALNKQRMLRNQVISDCWAFDRSYNLRKNEKLNKSGYPPLEKMLGIADIHSLTFEAGCNSRPAVRHSQAKPATPLGGSGATPEPTATVWMGEGMQVCVRALARSRVLSCKIHKSGFSSYLCLEDQVSLISTNRNDITACKSRVNMRTLASRPAWQIFLLSFILLLVIWQLVVMIGGYDRFILPGPVDVWNQFRIVAGDGRLVTHSLHTVSEVLPGLFIGCLIAVPLGYLLARSPLAERLISPYLIASQAIPIIAIAPLLTIWIRSTYWSRVAVAVLVVIFPVTIGIITGMRNVPHELYDLMHSFKASRWQIFKKLELPAATPVILAGVKVGATLAVIGALVGEFVQPKTQGLGYLLVTARYQFKTDQVFVVLITLAVIALSMYGAVALLERRLLYWKSSNGG